MNGFFKTLARVFIACFSGYGLVVQGAAALLTTFLVFSGVDWFYYEVVRNLPLIGVVMFAGVAGFLVPALSPLCLWLFGLSRKDKTLVLLACTVATAEIIAFMLAAIYKAFTGRLQPNLANGVDISHSFQFGILNNGIFWGWPSSHTIVAFAGVFVVILSVRSRAVRIACLFYAVLIGFGASVGFHWLSDVVAGVLMGVLVAFNTHREFRRVIELL